MARWKYESLDYDENLATEIQRLEKDGYAVYDSDSRGVYLRKAGDVQAAGETPAPKSKPRKPRSRAKAKTDTQTG